MKYLPLRDDDVEAKIVHAQLLRLVKTKNAQLLPPAALPTVCVAQALMSKLHVTVPSNGAWRAGLV